MARNDLRLKAEVISSPAHPPSGFDSLAHVWVDSGVFHLDGAFSYLIPGDLDAAIKVGSLVIVPFNGRELSALVLSRGPWDGKGNLKSITATEGRFALVTPMQIELVKILTQKYISHPFDLIRSIVPQRVVSVEKNRSAPIEAFEIKAGDSGSLASDLYLQLPPHRARAALMAKKLQELISTGPTLALFPDVREVDAIALELEYLQVEFTRYDSSQSRGEHYSAYLDILSGSSTLIIGTRSAIFTPVQGLKNVVIYNEGSQHFYEQRSPGWSVSDVAHARATLETLQITYIGYTPSLEIMKMMKQSAISFRRASHRLSVEECEQPYGELIPSRAMASIKSSLRDGPILFITPAKGWAHAIRCTRCKTLSKCKCGGNFEIASESSSITCNHCGSLNSHWRCIWCEHSQYSLVGRGMERHSHEIGALFPGQLIRSSNADTPFQGEITEGIVISTHGLAPRAKNGYSAVIFLEGNRALNQADMRSQERMMNLYFSEGALVQEKGRVILIQDAGSSIATALRLWNPIPTLERELEERLDLALPPFAHTIELTMAKEEITRLKAALIKSRDEGRLPHEVKILGPILKGDKSSIVISSSLEGAEAVNRLIHEFMRRRSATKKILPSLRINPYSLSR